MTDRRIAKWLIQGKYIYAQEIRRQFILKM